MSRSHASGQLVADGGCLALVGEAGIGKTRLARWAAERADERRMAVVEGAAGPRARRAARRHARPGALRPPHREPSRRCAIRWRPAFPAQLLPELGGDAGDGGNLGATFEAAARYVAALADRRGALVVLEDLHWADATSLSLVPFLARTARAPGLALLLTYRHGEHDTTPALEGLRAELRRSRLADEMVLEPLGAADAAAMLTEVLGRPPSARRDPGAAAPGGRQPVRAGGARPGRRRVRLARSRDRAPPGNGRRRRAVDARGVDPRPRRRAARAAARAHRLGRAARKPASTPASSPARPTAHSTRSSPGWPSSSRAGFLVEAGDDDLGMAFAFRHMLVHEALSREGLAARRRRLHARILDAAEELAADEGAGTLAGRARPPRDGRRRPAAHDGPFPRGGGRGPGARGGGGGGAAPRAGALAVDARTTGPSCGPSCCSPAGGCAPASARGDERAVELLELARDAYRGARRREPGRARGALAVLADARFEVGRRGWRRSPSGRRRSPDLRATGDREALRTALVGYARDAGAASSSTAAPRAPPTRGSSWSRARRPAAEARERVNLLMTRGMIAGSGDCDPAPRRGRSLEEAVALALAHHDDVSAARAHHILARPAACPAEPGRRAARPRSRRAPPSSSRRHGLHSLAGLVRRASGGVRCRRGRRLGACRAAPARTSRPCSARGAEPCGALDPAEMHARPVGTLLGLGELEEAAGCGLRRGRELRAESPRRGASSCTTAAAVARRWRVTPTARARCWAVPRTLLEPRSTRRDAEVTWCPDEGPALAAGRRPRCERGALVTLAAAALAAAEPPAASATAPHWFEPARATRAGGGRGRCAAAHALGSPEAQGWRSRPRRLRRGCGGDRAPAHAGRASPRRSTWRGRRWSASRALGCRGLGPPGLEAMLRSWGERAPTARRARRGRALGAASWRCWRWWPRGSPTARSPSAW